MGVGSATKIKMFVGALLLGAISCWGADALAQMFASEESTVSSASVNSAVSAPSVNRNVQQNQGAVKTQSMTKTYRRVPERNVAMRQVANSGTVSQGGEYIFLYYDNFSVNKTLGGMVRCNVRFIVMTTLAKKLNTLNVKLKWPNMMTSLSFNDVEPNVENYFDYTLVGNGCYSMDKIPNIIVNRCRVSQMTQEQCAAKILWLKKK